jgi:formylglycine-generating enzyme required for sulfatase activity
MLKNTFLRLFLSVTTAALCAGCKTIPPVDETPTPGPRAATQGPMLTQPEPTGEMPEAITPPAPESVLGDRKIRTLDEMELVFVPGGEFVMGSDEEEVDFALQQCLAYGANCSRRYFSVELPLHSVKLDSFWLDRTEVTSGQYQKCVADGACDPVRCDAPGDEYPVTCVTWSQAADYCQWAGARLPTEAEWEYSARGLGRKRYPWGNEFDGTLLNYCDHSCPLSKRDREFEDGYAESAPVGSYPGGASWVGAVDMAGNVWEMVADWNGTYPEQAGSNPTGPESGTRRVARGGSWHASPDHVRSAVRTHLSPTEIIDHAGFRCAQTNPPD